jgi:hypothetical protein
LEKRTEMLGGILLPSGAEKFPRSFENVLFPSAIEKFRSSFFTGDVSPFGEEQAPVA